MIWIEFRIIYSVQLQKHLADNRLHKMTIQEYNIMHAPLDFLLYAGL